MRDAGEQRFLRRALEREGLAAGTREELARHGFFVCDADLEDELLRALGVEATEAVLYDEGELALFRRCQHLLAQRERTPHEQLHRFAGVRSGRKVRLAGAMAAALEPRAAPEPLRALLKYVAP